MLAEEMFFFFFQAEDGIRDSSVTGVQTCALPIFTAVEWLHGFDPDAARQDIHGLLGQMLFSGEEGLKPTDALSGGETARLLFCRIMLQKPNVLVLDEPTNHLDLESINALNVALQKYDGTVLLVTHDQDLLEEVGTRVWQFEDGRIRDFKGTYEELSSGSPA